MATFSVFPPGSLARTVMVKREAGSLSDRIILSTFTRLCVSLDGFLYFSLLLFLFSKGCGLLVSLGYRRYRPCTCDLSTSSSMTTLYGDLILRGASCLDAFSTYPVQTRLPGGAPGGTTGAPAVCPTRSSRTSVGSSQISCAHNR